MRDTNRTLELIRLIKRSAGGFVSVGDARRILTGCMFQDAMKRGYIVRDEKHFTHKQGPTSTCRVIRLGPVPYPDDGAQVAVKMRAKQDKVGHLTYFLKETTSCTVQQT